MGAVVGILIIFGFWSQKENRPVESKSVVEASQLEASGWMGDIKLRKVRPEEVSK